MSILDSLIKINMLSIIFTFPRFPHLFFLLCACLVRNHQSTDYYSSEAIKYIQIFDHVRTANSLP
jgi:hypothetical protein